MNAGAKFMKHQILYILKNLRVNFHGQRKGGFQISHELVDILYFSKIIFCQTYKRLITFNTPVLHFLSVLICLLPGLLVVTMKMNA